MNTVDIRTLATTASRRSHRPSAHDYSQNPMLVYWEMTQACALACLRGDYPAARNQPASDGVPSEQGGGT